jgi:predicted trehalose synthase
MAPVAVLGEALSHWIGHQRWFSGKGAAPLLRLLGSLEWPAHDDVRVLTHLVLDEGVGRGALYQVPVTYRELPLDGAQGAFIAELDDPDGKTRYAYDAPHDPAFADLLLRLIVEGGSVGDSEVSAQGAPLRQPDASATSAGALRSATSRVLAGEQSNTSIVYSFTDAADAAGRQVICKLFRSLHHGENPDVVLQSALFAAGSESVPAVVGSVAGEWPDAGRLDGRARGHLAFAQEFLAGAVDAWRLALRSATEGTSFADSARQMGTATADVHSVLATALPAREATRVDVAEFARGWQERLDTAVREVPELEELREPIERLYARAVEASWPRLQRIHGDLHLGQILAVPGPKWAIIDFEGEPMRPLASRSLVDVPLRDVAGMLRSFDYVAGACADAPGVHEWSRACREAFLEGYVERAGPHLASHSVVLDAFELDKAMYEAVYEARNRPSWLSIPVTAARALALRSRS